MEAGCMVEWRDEEFTRQHARKFRSGITLHFFVVQHADYDDALIRTRLAGRLL